MKIFRDIAEFLRNIIKIDTQESSKRFVALYSMLLVSYVVIRFTDKSNAITVLEYLLMFVGVLMGVIAWQKTKTNNNNIKDEN